MDFSTYTYIYSNICIYIHVTIIKEEVMNLRMSRWQWKEKESRNGELDMILVFIYEIIVLPEFFTANPLLFILPDLFPYLVPTIIDDIRIKINISTRIVTIPNNILLFLVRFFIFSFNFPPRIRNVPKTNGINPIKLIANVDGSNAIEDILFILFPIWS